jgi:hypothetical protein
VHQVERRKKRKRTDEEGRGRAERPAEINWDVRKREREGERGCLVSVCVYCSELFV